MGKKYTLIGVLVLIFSFTTIKSEGQTKNIHSDLPTEKVISIVNSSDDDAEEKLTTNSVNLTSSDLELISNGRNDQVVGIRFNKINVPQGSIITQAKILFKANETASTWTNLILSAEAVDHANAFSDEAGNISNRNQTTASISWSGVEPWTSTEASHASPNLAPVIQEVVDRFGWKNNNSITILIEGSGGRTVESYDGSPKEAPLLEIEYLVNNSYSFNSDDAVMTIANPINK